MRTAAPPLATVNGAGGGSPPAYASPATARCSRGITSVTRVPARAINATFRCMCVSPRRGRKAAAGRSACCFAAAKNTGPTRTSSRPGPPTGRPISARSLHERTGGSAAAATPGAASAASTPAAAA